MGCFGIIEWHNLHLGRRDRRYYSWPIPGGVTSVAFSPDNKLVVLSGGLDLAVRISREQISETPSETVAFVFRNDLVIVAITAASTFDAISSMLYRIDVVLIYLHIG
jgi:hypothetical protein